MNGPIDRVNQLVNAMNGGDLAAALASYEPDAVLVAQPGQVARGAAGLRTALAGFLALKPVLVSQAQKVIEAGNIALYVARWELRGTDRDGKELVLRGHSTDVLRRGAGGRWLISIDNPWGAQILDLPSATV